MSKKIKIHIQEYIFTTVQNSSGAPPSFLSNGYQRLFAWG